MDIPEIATFAAALLAVLALIMAIAWALRRFFGGAERPGTPPLRRRNRRLAIVEGVQIGNRHRLLLVRRDDTEHLLLIGGATELVVESGIPHPDAEAEVNIRNVEPRFGPGGPSLPDRDTSYDRPDEPPARRPFDPQSFSRPEFTSSFSTRRSEADEPDVGYRDRGEDDDYRRRGYGAGEYDDRDNDRPSYLTRSGAPLSDAADDREHGEEPPAPRSFGSLGSGRSFEDEREREPDDESDDSPEQAHSRILSRFLKRDGE